MYIFISLFAFVLLMLQFIKALSYIIENRLDGLIVKIKGEDIDDVHSYLVAMFAAFIIATFVPLINILSLAMLLIAGDEFYKRIVKEFTNYIEGSTDDEEEEKWMC